MKKNLEKIPKKDKIAIFERIEALAQLPRPEGVVYMKAISQAIAGSELEITG